MQDDIEFIRHLHHWSMPAFIYEMQLTVGYQLIELTYQHIQPWGPKIMDGIGKIIPFFKGMFQDLEDFFDGVSKQVPPAN